MPRPVQRARHLDCKCDPSRANIKTSQYVKTRKPLLFGRLVSPFRVFTDQLDILDHCHKDVHAGYTGFHGLSVRSPPIR